MNFIHFFSHAEELHSAETSEFEHILAQPAVAIPLYLLVGLAIYTVFSTYKKGGVLPGLLIYNLLCGLLLYNLVPVISIVALTIGMALALIVALGTIAAGK